MATKMYEFEGEAMWANELFVPDNFSGVETYRVRLIANEENLKKFKESGIRTKVKESEDGRPMLLIKRAKEGKEMPDGTTFGGGQPEIVDSDGNNWGNSGYIGNGSQLRCTVAVYDTRMGKGHRLEKVQVLDLVEPVTEEPSTKVVEEKKVNKKVPF